MKASITITTYQRKKLSEDAILGLHNSFLREEFEIIVVDNASTDGTKEMLKKMKNDNIIDKLIINKKNRYLGAAINQAWKKSSKEAEWVMHFPNDTHFMKEWFINFIKVSNDLNMDYFWCTLHPVRYGSDYTIPEKTKSGGIYMKPIKFNSVGGNTPDRSRTKKSKPYFIGLGLAIKRNDIIKNNIRFKEGNFEVNSPFSVIAKDLYKKRFQCRELGKPCAIISDELFNSKEYEDYYTKRYTSFKKLRKRGIKRLNKMKEYGCRNPQNAENYYEGSGHECCGKFYPEYRWYKINNTGEYELCENPYKK